MSSLPLLIQKMQQPEFYPHPVTQPIQIKQTHGSFVLLTGEFVYKVKKSVDLGFFDYSTVEKRRHFCQEELHLNQRGRTGNLSRGVTHNPRGRSLLPERRWVSR